MKITVIIPVYNSKKTIYKCIRSVLNQTYKDWEWHIFTSNELPENYKKKLEQLTSSYTSIKICYIKNFKEFNFKPRPY